MQARESIDFMTPDQCCGCAACVDKCPSKAIAMGLDKDGNRMPHVDAKNCTNCGLCVKVCPRFNDGETAKSEWSKKAYLGYYNNKNISSKSSSGGIFAAFAHYILERGGVVYGAAMCYNEGRLSCKHIRITDMRELSLLQGSKYVQSHTDGIFKKVKSDLKDGKQVLFSGTSCQVASLKCFIGDSENLYTIDLVCHGVPKDQLFYDYIDYYEKTHKCKITDVSFRAKGISYHGKDMLLTLTFRGEKKGKPFERRIFQNKSAYYCLYMGRAGYRLSCYHCIYASVEKPADITLGDWNVREEDVKMYKLDNKEIHSTIIIHTEKGAHLLDEISERLTMTEIPLQFVVEHHGNLHGPSTMTERGSKMYKSYKQGGYAKLQRCINYRFMKSEIVWIVKNVFCKHL